MQRMMGQGVSSATADEWPELAKNWASAEINMPREASMTGDVRPMNRLEKFLTGGATAKSYPWGTLAINREATTQDNNLRDTLAHELVHSGQAPRGLTQILKDYFTPWDKIPNEQEAKENERTYKWKQYRADRKLR